MAFIANEFRFWAGTDDSVWARHENQDCMEVETWPFATLVEILDWVDAHVCAARV